MIYNRLSYYFLQQIFFHGNNLVNLHTMIHKESLPTELGGLKPPYNNFSWAKQLIGCNFQPRLRNDRPIHHQQITDIDINRLVVEQCRDGDWGYLMTFSLYTFYFHR